MTMTAVERNLWLAEEFFGSPKPARPPHVARQTQGVWEAVPAPDHEENQPAHVWRAIELSTDKNYIHLFLCRFDEFGFPPSLSRREGSYYLELRNDHGATIFEGAEVPGLGVMRLLFEGAKRVGDLRRTK